MCLASIVARVSEVVGAFAWRVGAKQGSDGGADLVASAGCGVAQQVLELGEDLLDRAQVGRIFGQQEELGTAVSERFSDGGNLWLS